MKLLTERIIQATFSCANDRVLEVSENSTYINGKTKHSDIIQSIIHLRPQVQSKLFFEKDQGNADKHKKYQDLSGRNS